MVADSLELDFRASLNYVEYRVHISCASAIERDYSILEKLHPEDVRFAVRMVRNPERAPWPRLVVFRFPLTSHRLEPSRSLVSRTMKRTRARARYYPACGCFQMKRFLLIFTKANKPASSIRRGPEDLTVKLRTLSAVGHRSEETGCTSQRWWWTIAVPVAAGAHCSSQKRSNVHLHSIANAAKRRAGNN